MSSHCESFFLRAKGVSDNRVDYEKENRSKQCPLGVFIGAVAVLCVAELG